MAQHSDQGSPAPSPAVNCSLQHSRGGAGRILKPLSSVVHAPPPQLSFQRKVGILYCRAGQGSEEEMYNNEEAGPAFTQFLTLLGDVVRLKGFESYRAQLDTKSEVPGGDCRFWGRALSASFSLLPGTGAEGGNWAGNPAV